MSARASSPDRIGIELNPSVIRGVRIGRRPRAVEVRVEKDRETEAFRRAINQLGTDASIRLVMRGLGVSTTRIVPHRPEEVGSLTEHIPIPERDAVWDVVGLPDDRSLLLAAQRRRLEEVLDGWGITPNSSVNPDAVGLTLAALVAISPELEVDRDLVWIDSPRMLHVRREGVRIIEAWAATSIPAGAILCGPGASEVSQAHPMSTVFRPGGFDSAYTVAWGAAHWGDEALPDLPNLEPRDRREWRARVAAARAVSRKVMAASLTMLVAGASAYGFAWSDRAEAETERDAAVATRTTAEARTKSAADAVAARGVGISRGGQISRGVARLMAIAARHTGAIYLTELSTQGSTARFASLGSDRAEHHLRGRARTLEAVEAFRADLQNDGFEATVEEATETARPAFAVDFQVRVR